MKSIKIWKPCKIIDKQLNIPNKKIQLKAWQTVWNKLKIEYQEQKTKRQSRRIKTNTKRYEKMLRKYE
jgi:hypothetical protein